MDKIKKKDLLILSDTTKIDTLSLNPDYFHAYLEDGTEIDPQNYQVIFSKGLFIRKGSFIQNGRKIGVQYMALPIFMTRSYSAFDPALIVPKATGEGMVFSSSSGKKQSASKPFDGLSTRGSLSRGVTIGSNQDAVVNSNFNLQIEGRLSSKVGIRASITDNEIPLQTGGFTQRLDEFDKVFIELFSDKWTLRAGDLDLINTESHFMRFQKKVSGVSVQVRPGKNTDETEIFASGALVRGKFHSYKFTGQDGNQGPYLILGPDNEQFVVMISGSERVYANGVLLQRGENFDYTIDYNTAEITFTSLYTVTSNLRFTIEYQFSERNYTRFLTYDGFRMNKENWYAGVKYYNESDAKNSTSDQDLNDEQKNILADAGNDTSKMIAPSAVPAEYDENRVLYRKEVSGEQEIYVYSNDPDDELYQVSFSFVGDNNGDYIIETTLASGRVYAFVEEVGGVKQGAYLPFIQLVAPESFQMINLEGGYSPSEKTNVRAEVSISDADQNLFSDIDNDKNTGYATKVTWDQRIVGGKWKLDGLLGLEYLSENFNTIERIRNVEFSRDWNIDQAILNQGSEQQYLSGGLNFSNDSIGVVRYNYQNLSLGDDYSGSRHQFFSGMQWKGFNILIDGSLMRNEELFEKNSFDRLYSRIVKSISNYWVGGKFDYERNVGTDLNSGTLDPMSQEFIEIEGFGGVGDSTKVFLELGYNYRENDSVVVSSLENVNQAHTYFLKSRLVKNENADLSLFINYRNVRNEFRDDDSSINGRLNYRQRIFKDFIQFQTLLEARSGNLPQQEFTYVEVEPGKGFYEWIDFNGNQVQELDEFVVARFPDQAIYVRVLLPSVNFIKTDQNKWSQSLQLNGNGWKNRGGFLKFLSHFNNQTYLLLDTKTKRVGSDFQWLPIGFSDEALLGLDQVLKNSFFYNRGLQKFSLVYTYLNSRKRTIYTFGDQDIQLKSHQIQFIHKLGNYWLMEIESGTGFSSSNSLAFSNRNFELNTFNIRPKISYLYNQNTRLEFMYTFKNKENQIMDFETLVLHNLGANFRYANRQKFTLNTSVNLIYNDFEGDTNSPVAFQMLEGLQPGTNYTWLFGMQKRLTSFLDLNINYLGRKSEETDAIHTGTVQLRATF